MFDFAAARRMMVDGQVRTSDVTDLRLIAAMLDIPRERFVPPEMAELAYLDLDTPVVKQAPATPVRRMLKPMVLAKLIQAAEIREGDRVLDVGCTTGYASAVMARLAGSVVALEEDPTLARLAAENLQSFGLGRTQSVAGPLVEGCAQRKPFDAIVINGAFEVLPDALVSQLKDGGRLVGIRGRAPAAKAMLYRATAGDFSGRAIFDAAAPLLPGFVAPAAFVF